MRTTPTLSSVQPNPVGDCQPRARKLMLWCCAGRSKCFRAILAAMQSSSQQQRDAVPLASLRMRTILLGAHRRATAQHLQLSGSGCAILSQQTLQHMYPRHVNAAVSLQLCPAQLAQTWTSVGHHSMLRAVLWRSAGQVDTSRRASGFGAHPAVVDNCMQLGPVSGRLGLIGEESTAGTRVIGGIGAFLVAPAAREDPSPWAAAERAPAAADGAVCSSHWLTGAEGLRLQLQDLQVCIMPHSSSSNAATWVLACLPTRALRLSIPLRAEARQSQA